MAEALKLTGLGLEDNDDDLAERAMSCLRDLRDRLAVLGRTRDASRGEPAAPRLAAAHVERR